MRGSCGGVAGCKWLAGIKSSHTGLLLRHTEGTTFFPCSEVGGIAPPHPESPPTTPLDLFGRWGGRPEEEMTAAPMIQPAPCFKR